MSRLEDDYDFGMFSGDTDLVPDMEDGDLAPDMDFNCPLPGEEGDCDE